MVKTDSASTYRLQILQGSTVKKEIDLPCFGEVRIVSHEGDIKTVETTIKEKLN